MKEGCVAVAHAPKEGRIINQARSFSPRKLSAHFVQGWEADFVKQELERTRQKK